MKISEEFPSKWIKAADLQDRNVMVVMANVEKEEIGKEMKLVLYFKGKERGLVLNKTNSNTIVDAYGDDTEDWFGKEIVLFPIMTDFQGKSVEAVRVRAPMPKDRPQQRREDPISTGANGGAGNEYRQASNQGNTGQRVNILPRDEEIPFAPEVR